MRKEHLNIDRTNKTYTWWVVTKAMYIFNTLNSDGVECKEQVMK